MMTSHFIPPGTALPLQRQSEPYPSNPLTTQELLSVLAQLQQELITLIAEILNKIEVSRAAGGDDANGLDGTDPPDAQLGG